jgi:hypothetical protein
MDGQMVLAQMARRLGAALFRKASGLTKESLGE